MDTTPSSSAQKNWALWAAVAMLAAGTLVLLYVFFAASSKPEPSTGLARFATGEMRQLAVMEAPPLMPTRTVQDAAGQTTTLGAIAGGEVMVLNVWATYCAPCMHEMPTLAELQRRYVGRIRVIPVSVDGEGKREEARTKLAQLSGNVLPFFIDTTRGVAFDVQAPGMPITIIYDREGHEVARLAGGADWASDEAAALIDAVLEGERRGSSSRDRAPAAARPFGWRLRCVRRNVGG